MLLEPARAERMADGDRSAVDVDALGIEAEAVDRRERDRRERFIDLPERDVSGLEAARLEHVLDGVAQDRHGPAEDGPAVHVHVVQPLGEQFRRGRQAAAARGPAQHVAAAAVGAWRLHRLGITVGPFANAIAPALLVAQAVGRIGNYFNKELFGKPTTLPCGLEIPYQYRLAGGIPKQDLHFATFQPSFLYELIWDRELAALLTNKFEVLWASGKSAV